MNDRFQVLDRNQNIHKNYLLEASAGTGKTFSIENIVVRLLIENEAISLDQILVVTFTRPATRELKLRIHANLEKSCQYLQNAFKNPPEHNIDKVDYIERIVEEGQESIHKALRKLEQTLSCFDLAQIHTIHGFCGQMLSENMLEGNQLPRLDSTNDQFPNQRVRKIIRDYFRTGIHPSVLSQQQLELILKRHGEDYEKLENALLHVLKKGIDVEETPPFTSLVQIFSEKMRLLKDVYGLRSDKIYHDFLTLAPFLNGISDVRRQIKKGVSENIASFAALFEKESWSPSELNWLVTDQLYITECLDPSQLKKSKTKPPIEKLHYPNMIALFKEHLLPLVTFETAFSRMAFDCQKQYKSVQQQEELFSYDNILKSMHEAIKNDQFLLNVRSRYKAAIIDEFQDTDPLQWDIFQKLFLSDSDVNTILYLVGDPKQSIYAFRQADIYTYLSAAEKIGKGNHASLDTNYRSQKSLVTVLNALFCESSCPGFLYLPKIREWVHYPEVRYSEKIKNQLFSDNKGSVHFFISEDKKYSLKNSEENHFFPFIVQEIQQLVDVDGFQYYQIALLVSDRHQSQRLAAFLKKWNIPSVTQKSSSLVDSPAYLCLREFIGATLHPKDESLLKIALGGKIVGWNEEKVRSLDDLEKLEAVLYKFYQLREILINEGFASFFQQLLQTSWKEDSYSVLEQLMMEENSEEFLNQLLQIADLLLETDSSSRGTPEDLLQHLDELRAYSEGDEENLKILNDPSQNAVQILTTHSSKGLEFDIVFALGLVQRSPPTETQIPVEKDGKRVLIPINDKNSKEYREYCQELDSEKMRRLYVAMTRAKFRLYLPVLYVPEDTMPKIGTASPMELYLAKLGQKAIEEEHVYSRISEFRLETLKSFLDSLPKETEITYTILNEKPVFLTKTHKNSFAELVPPPQIVVPGTAKYIHSFTSLSNHSQNITTNETLVPPHDFHAALKSPHTLPSGSETGILLHKILELFPFEKYKGIQDPAEHSDFVAPFLSGTEFADWSPVLCQILFNAAFTPLKGLFRFADLSSDRCYKECEFLYQSTLKHNPGYIKGLMDLFFEHEGKYYLLDWKSNWLGPCREDYHREHLEKAMQENQYFLQASLYTEALKKYLKLVDPRPFKTIYGGIFYIFVRGLDPHANDQNGIYFYNPEE